MIRYNPNEEVEVKVEGLAGRYTARPPTADKWVRKIQLLELIESRDPAEKFEAIIELLRIYQVTDGTDLPVEQTTTISGLWALLNAAFEALEVTGDDRKNSVPPQPSEPASSAADAKPAGA